MSPTSKQAGVTAGRNQNSIGDRMEKKILGETRLSRGGAVLLWPDEPAVCAEDSSGFRGLVHWPSRRQVLHWDLSLGLI